MAKTSMEKFSASLQGNWIELRGGARVPSKNTLASSCVRVSAYENNVSMERIVIVALTVHFCAALSERAREKFVFSCMYIYADDAASGVARANFSFAVEL